MAGRLAIVACFIAASGLVLMEAPAQSVSPAYPSSPHEQLRLASAAAGGEPVEVASAAAGDDVAVALAADTLGQKSPETRPAPVVTATEVAGFELQGKQPWERFRIDDLDVVVDASGRRFIPLLRLLRALGVETAEAADTLTFQPEKGPKVVVNTRTGLVQINSHLRQSDLVVATSEITRQRDVYLLPDVVSEILGVELQWNDEEYAFIGRTGRRLKVWTLANGGSLLGIPTEQIPTNLPEMLPTARSPRASLDFLELQLRSQFATTDNMRGRTIGIDAPRETFFGNFLGGTYKLQFTQPSLFWDREGMRETDEPAVMLNWADWTCRFRNSELVIGDSQFGLNDLTFPIVRLTGIRVNGVAGALDGDQCVESSSFGLRNYFVQPHTFEVTAPLGSKVELVVNDRPIDIEPEFTDSPTPGYGIYRFDPIRLPPGVLNDVRIKITDPSGFRTVLHRSYLGSTALLPAGRLAYLGALGTSRRSDEWRTRGIFAGGRAVYGLTDRLTVGATAAVQEHFFRRYDEEGLMPGSRQLPVRSAHLGAQFSWLLHDTFLLSGDASFSQAEDMTEAGGAVGDLAFKIHGDFQPLRNLRIRSEFFRYGPDFFNGQNPDLRDRQGYFVNAVATPHPRWSLSASAGSVRNNLSGDLPETLVVDFQNLEITTTQIPRATASLKLDRIAPQGAEEAKMLYTMKLQVSPFSKTNFYGSVSTGDSLTLVSDPQFFSGLSLPGVSTYDTPSASALVTQGLTREHDVGVNYTRTDSRQRATVFHSYRAAGNRRLQVRTELGTDIFKTESESSTMSARQPYFENRIEYLLDRSGQKRLGVQTRYEREEWTAMVYLNVAEVFAFDRGQPKPVSERQIQPERGGVHGRVFVDYDANGIMDSGEPGLEGVTVAADNLYKTVTDKHGYYIIPGVGRLRKARVWIELDSLPATYFPTHGIQSASVTARSLTVVNLGVMPLICVVGRVVANGGLPESRPLGGLRVNLIDADGKVVADSITAGDGTYYFGEVRPRAYIVEIDLQTVPEGCSLVEHRREIHIPPQTEPADIEVPDFTAVCAPAAPPK